MSEGRQQVHIKDDHTDFEYGDEALCYCEYYNRRNQRAHLFQICCNCESLDRLATVLFCCECTKRIDYSNDYHGAGTSSSMHELKETLLEVYDRLRVPRPGGARKINPCFFFSLLYVFIYVYVGTINLFASISVIFGLPTVSYVYFFWSRLKKKPFANMYPFFVGLSSLIILCFIFNFYLLDELTRVSFGQKFAFNFLIVSLILVIFYLHYSDPGNLKRNSLKATTGSIETTICKKCVCRRDDQSGHCPECNRCIYKRDLHCYWLGNCVGYSNQKIYVIYLLLLASFFINFFFLLRTQLSSYECSLSKLWYESEEKLNKDAEFSCLFDVYYSNFNRSFLICSFLQILPMTAYSIMLVVQKFFFISLSVTQLDLYRMGQRNIRFSLAIFIIEHFNLKQAAQNWLQFLFTIRRSGRDIANYQKSMQLGPTDNQMGNFVTNHFV